MGVLAYTRADFSVLSVPFSATCVWLLLRGARTGEWWAGALLGIVFAAFTLFAFTSLMLAVAMGLIVIVGLALKELSLRSGLRTVLVAGVVTVAVFVALHVWSGFSIYECLQQGRADEAAKFGGGFDDATRYLFRSIGHVLAYVVGSGYVLAGFALMALPKLWPGRAENRLVGIVAWSLAGAILFAGFSGGFHGETERVWLFFTPLLAVVAGYEWQRRSMHEGSGLIVGVIALVLVGNCAQELFYHHQSRNIRMGVQRHRMMQMEDDF
jgi:hypothetical protein